MISRAIASCAVFLLLSLSTFAQFDPRRPSTMQTNGSLSVRVVDSNGAVTDARVEVRDQQFSQVVRSGYTNVQGVAELVGIPFGMYEVVVTKGLAQQTTTMAIQSMGATATMNLGAAHDVEAEGKNTVSVAEYKVPGKARKEMQKARKALNERKLEEAAERVEKALQIYPKYAEALTTRAVLKLDRNEIESAQGDLDKALEYDPNYVMAYLVYGASLNLQSKYDRAIETLERGKALDPTAWQAYFELGKAFVGKGDYKQAVKQLDRAQVMVNFRYPAIHLVKAHALLSLKEYSPAMVELEAFLEQSPDDPMAGQARKTLAEVKAFAQR